MSGWIDIDAVANFPVGSWRVVNVDEVSVLVFNLKGEFYAIENVCTHDGGVLSTGHVEGDEIVCPRHGAKFCIKTGAVTAPPAYEDVPTFPVRVIDGRIQLRDARWD